MLFPVVAVEEANVSEANALLTKWDHPLGACHRPFGQQAHVMVIDGKPVACTISASTVSPTCGGDPRDSLVELARIGREPEARWVLRPMLRIWREVLAPAWPYWMVRTAVSYALPGTPGDMYRFDGWERVGPTRPSAGGGTWSNAPQVNQIADGVKTLWRWRYPNASELARTA